MKILYTDIDYVLSLDSEYVYHNTQWGNIQKFNDKAVKAYNRILNETGALPVISSDWKNDYSLIQLRQIFSEWAGINTVPIDVTPTIPGIVLQRQAEWRAMEILQHVKENNPKIWVAIDDLDLSNWIDEEHFVHLRKSNEGIKQSGKADKVIKLLNKK